MRRGEEVKEGSVVSNEDGTVVVGRVGDTGVGVVVDNPGTDDERVQEHDCCSVCHMRSLRDLGSAIEKMHPSHEPKSLG